jgi:anti-anti-sigma regulatory factor
MNAVIESPSSGRRRGSRPALERLAPAGRLDATAALRLRRTGEQLVAEGPEQLLIDLVAVTGLDAAGLAAVTHTALAARRRGIDCQISPPIAADARRILALTGVDRLLDMTGDRR